MEVVNWVNKWQSRFLSISCCDSFDLLTLSVIIQLFIQLSIVRKILHILCTPGVRRCLMHDSETSQVKVEHDRTELIMIRSDGYAGFS